MFVVEETAVAKGIRRVTGVTGEEAVAAMSRAEALEHEVKILVADVAVLVKGSGDGAGAGAGDAMVLDAALIALRQAYLSS